MKNLFPLIILITVFLLPSCNNKNAEYRELRAELDSTLIKLQALETEKEKREANKKMVADMYQELFGDKNLDAIDKYIAEDYIQHNPSVADGSAALKEAFKGLKNAPKSKIDIRNIGADGDLVFIHTRLKMGENTASVIDIFRIEGDKIKEHWDVIQQVPKKAANDHPMF